MGEDVPRELWDVLTFSGERYRREGWSSVPGTRLVRYVFQNPPFRRAPVPTARKASLVRPTAARFAIRSSVLPRLTEALAIGERLRQSAMSQSKNVCGDAKPVFSGHGQTAPDHRHAMYLSANDDPSRRGFIDHLLICAKDGFEDDDVVALQRMRRLWGKGGHDLELVLVGLGQPKDFGGLQLPSTRLLGTSRVWQSLTPFVPPRHPKVVRGVAKDTIEDQIARGCQHLLGVAPVQIQPFSGSANWLEFRRRRYHGGGSRGPDQAVGARLTFESPVSGPIALGYGAHFGLGVFVAVEEPIESSGV